MTNRESVMIILTVGLIKKRHSVNEWMFSEPKSLRANVKVELDLSNYSTKADLKKRISCWYSGFC